MRLAVSIAAALCAICVALAAHAHSKLESATPKSGSTLSSSPTSIDITFKHAVRLTSVVVVDAAGERKASFSPSGAARAFSITAPQLAGGRNEVRWKALSADGHVIDGALIYVVNPASTKTP